MGAINAMTSYQKTFGLTGEGSSTGIIFIIYNCKTPSSIIISPVNTTDISILQVVRLQVGAPYILGLFSK